MNLRVRFLFIMASTGKLVLHIRECCPAHHKKRVPLLLHSLHLSIFYDPAMQPNHAEGQSCAFFKFSPSAFVSYAFFSCPKQLYLTSGATMPAAAAASSSSSPSSMADDVSSAAARGNRFEEDVVQWTCPVLFAHGPCKSSGPSETLRASATGHDDERRTTGARHVDPLSATNVGEAEKIILVDCKTSAVRCSSAKVAAQVAPWADDLPVLAATSIALTALVVLEWWHRNWSMINAALPGCKLYIYQPLFDEHDNAAALEWFFKEDGAAADGNVDLGWSQWGHYVKCGRMFPDIIEVSSGTSCVAAATGAQFTCRVIDIKSSLEASDGHFMQVTYYATALALALKKHTHLNGRVSCNTATGAVWHAASAAEWRGPADISHKTATPRKESPPFTEHPFSTTISTRHIRAFIKWTIMNILEPHHQRTLSSASSKGVAGTDVVPPDVPWTLSSRCASCDHLTRCRRDATNPTDPAKPLWQCVSTCPLPTTSAGGGSHRGTALASHVLKAIVPGELPLLDFAEAACRLSMITSVPALCDRGAGVPQWSLVHWPTSVDLPASSSLALHRTNSGAKEGICISVVLGIRPDTGRVAAGVFSKPRWTTTHNDLLNWRVDTNNATSVTECGSLDEVEAYLRKELVDPWRSDPTMPVVILVWDDAQRTALNAFIYEHFVSNKVGLVAIEDARLTGDRLGDNRRRPIARSIIALDGVLQATCCVPIPAPFTMHDVARVFQFDPAVASLKDHFVGSCTPWSLFKETLEGTPPLKSQSSKALTDICALIPHVLLAIQLRDAASPTGVLPSPPRMRERFALARVPIFPSSQENPRACDAAAGRVLSDALAFAMNRAVELTREERRRCAFYGRLRYDPDKVTPSLPRFEVTAAPFWRSPLLLGLLGADLVDRWSEQAVDKLLSTLKVADDKLCTEVLGLTNSLPWTWNASQRQFYAPKTTRAGTEAQPFGYHVTSGIPMLMKHILSVVSDGGGAGGGWEAVDDHQWVAYRGFKDKPADGQQQFSLCEYVPAPPPPPGARASAPSRRFVDLLVDRGLTAAFKKASSIVIGPRMVMFNDDDLIDAAEGANAQTNIVFANCLLRQPDACVPWRLTRQSAAGMAAAVPQQVLDHLDDHSAALLWGPPGTGKTYTIARIVLQLFSRWAASGTASRPKILISASTHRALAAVELALDSAMTEGAYRGTACNVLRWKSGDKAKELKLIAADVALCTVYKAGKLYAKKSDYIPDLIILDEASQVTVAQALLLDVTMAGGGAATTPNRPRTRLLVVGDPMQLPPVSQCEFDQRPTSEARLLGSIFAAMLFCKQSGEPSPPGRGDATPTAEVYRTPISLRDFVANPAAFQVANLFALTECRRCRPAIASVLAPLYPAGFTSQRRERPNHHCLTHVSLDRRGDEPAVVGVLVQRLIASGITDIKIVTPRHVQRRAVLKVLEPHLRGWVDGGAVILVDTVDAFQGGEAQAVIIAYGNLDASEFAFSAQRVNVALSRAKDIAVLLTSAHILAPVGVSHAALRAVDILTRFVEAAAVSIDVSSAVTHARPPHRDNTASTSSRRRQCITAANLFTMLTEEHWPAVERHDDDA